MHTMRHKATRCLFRNDGESVNLRHGQSRHGNETHLWLSWNKMRSRPNAGVCGDWNKFECFESWANQNGYAQGLTLCRRDKSKGHNPENCFWGTRSDWHHKSHGGSRDKNGKHSQLFRAWQNMRLRCQGYLERDRINYTARGITVCPEWQGSFASFQSWALSNGFLPGLSLDRKDNDGNYEPNNCRWVDRKQQMRNTRSNRRIKAFGDIKCLSEWVEDRRCPGISAQALKVRLDRGWNAEAAISTPLKIVWHKKQGV